MTTGAAGCRAHDGWLLTPEGAAIRPDEAAAVVADLHLGYEWARGSAGDCVPAHSLAETTVRLERLLDRAEIHKLVVAGDLVESARPCTRTAADVSGLTGWLREREVELVVVLGNHDRSLPWMCARASGRSGAGPTFADAEQSLAGWTICHGHRPTTAERVVMGHHHPALVVERTTAPCFLVGSRLVILPAFSPNAAGLDVASLAAAKRWPDRELRCVAAAGPDLLDFGPLRTLAARIGASRAVSALPPRSY